MFSCGGPPCSPRPMTGAQPSARRMKWEMFALSFTALFLEMMLIRWVPSVVHLVAYYANLMLLSSFLGLGAGAMAAGRRWNVFGWFPLFLAADIGMLLLNRNVVLGASSTEVRFNAPPALMIHSLVLIEIFALNALLFVPIGQRMGTLFNALPRLTAYAWDLGGSLCGTLTFGIFSLELFSPVLGMAFVMLIYLMLQAKRWFLNLVVFAGVLAAVSWNGDRNAIWSPYYFLTITDLKTPGATVSKPPADLLTMRDPPAYFVQVNQFGYHVDASLDLARYTPGSWGAKEVAWLRQQYDLINTVSGGRDRVLVVGAGGGCDVGGPLRRGQAC